MAPAPPARCPSGMATGWLVMPINTRLTPPCRSSASSVGRSRPRSVPGPRREAAPWLRCRRRSRRAGRRHSQKSRCRAACPGAVPVRAFAPGQPESTRPRALGSSGALEMAAPASTDDEGELARVGRACRQPNGRRGRPGTFNRTRSVARSRPATVAVSEPPGSRTAISSHSTEPLYVTSRSGAATSAVAGCRGGPGSVLPRRRGRRPHRGRRTKGRQTARE